MGRRLDGKPNPEALRKRRERSRKRRDADPKAYYLARHRRRKARRQERKTFARLPTMEDLLAMLPRSLDQLVGL